MSKKSRKISKIFKKIIEKLQKSPILYIFCYFFLDELFAALPPASLLQSAGMAFFTGFPGFHCFVEQGAPWRARQLFTGKIPGGDFVPIAPPIPHRMFLN
ncbi:MAG: hypothetical protein J6P28_06925 [Treponema sp.]|nr:hypothetical protein [Treponema sp.]